ncbi:MAG: ferrous iron transport protein B [Elusimicrobia bacterium]|nr:ferrous iron transport protein B [Elusimicrobiota bacterium]
MLNPAPVSEGKIVATKRIVLVGQPNVGKSALFNRLTGRYVMVSNYPGTTVDVARGMGLAGNATVEFVDSPGINSLVVLSDEERVTRSLLFSGPDLIMQVADLKNLSRALSLTLELAELDIAMVLVLNMKDEALSRGYQVDSLKLSQMLGVPVVETVATTGEGFEELQAAFLRAARPVKKNVYPAPLAKAVWQAQQVLPVDIRHLGALFLQNHLTPEELIPLLKRDTGHEALGRLEQIRRNAAGPMSRLMAQSRQDEAGRLAAEVLKRPATVNLGKRELWVARLGAWCLQSWPGYLIAACVLWIFYEFVGVFAAQIAVDFLENVVFGKYVNPAVSAIVRTLIPWPFVGDMLIGDYGVFTMALTYAFALILPIVTAFFLALGVLEDTGYLPRLSVLSDRFFRAMGLNGKAVFPMILGLGCGTMAMLTTRILDTRKEKILASFLLALAVPCSAQLGVILGMASGMSHWVLAIWLVVTLGTLLGVGSALSRLLPGAASPLILEIPPMRVPIMGNLLKKVSSRLKWYLKEVVPIFVYATLVLYFFDAFGWLKALERWMEPVIAGFLGLPKQAAESFLVGFLRRDYGAAGLFQMQREGLLNVRQSTVAITAITLFMPCIAQFMMTVRERGMKAAAAISGFVLIYAVIVAGALNKVLLVMGW